MAAPTFPRALAAALLVVGALLPMRASADDRTADRAARRAQLQLQGLQQQVQDAQAAQSRADADKAEAEKKLAAQAQEIPKALAVARQAAGALKASESARADLQAKLAALEKQSADQKRADDAALAAKVAEMQELLRYRESQQRLLQARVDDQAAQGLVCADHNEKLVELSAELLDRYRRKGLADVVSQRDPVLGLGQVEMFNLVQDYRDRAEAQRLNATPSGQKP